jgi:hypothetical protein
MSTMPKAQQQAELESAREAYLKWGGEWAFDCPEPPTPRTAFIAGWEAAKRSAQRSEAQMRRIVADACQVAEDAYDENTPYWRAGFYAAIEAAVRSALAEPTIAVANHAEQGLTEEL